MPSGVDPALFCVLRSRRHAYADRLRACVHAYIERSPAVRRLQLNRVDGSIRWSRVSRGGRRRDPIGRGNVALRAGSGSGLPSPVAARPTRGVDVAVNTGRARAAKALGDTRGARTVHDSTTAPDVMTAVATGSVPRARTDLATGIAHVTTAVGAKVGAATTSDRDVRMARATASVRDERMARATAIAPGATIAAMSSVRAETIAVDTTRAHVGTTGVATTSALAGMTAPGTATVPDATTADMHRGPVGTMSGASPTPVAGMRTDPSGETALTARARAIVALAASIVAASIVAGRETADPVSAGDAPNAARVLTPGGTTARATPPTAAIARPTGAPTVAIAPLTAARTVAIAPPTGARIGRVVPSAGGRQVAAAGPGLGAVRIAVSVRASPSAG